MEREIHFYYYLDECTACGILEEKNIIFTFEEKRVNCEKCLKELKNGWKINKISYG